MPTRTTVLRQRRKLVELGWDLAEARTADEVDDLSLRAVHDVLGGELVGKNVVDLSTGNSIVRHFPDEFLDLDLNEAVTRTLYEHPAYLHFTTTLDLRPYKISDTFPSLLEFKRTRVYAEVFAPSKLGTPHQLNIIAQPTEIRPNALVISYALNRSESNDFTEHDRDLAADIQVLLIRAYRRIAAIPKSPVMSKRQLAILRLAADGKTHASIGAVLGIKPGTVARYLSDTYRILDVSGITEAVLAAERLGLLR